MQNAELVDNTPIYNRRIGLDSDYDILSQIAELPRDSLSGTLWSNPIRAGATIILAINDKIIMIAQKSPKVEKKPIFDWLMTMNPAKSERADPKRASPEAPPTTATESNWDFPSSISSLYHSIRWIT